MNWTPQQQQAIDTDGRSILVSAAAGSGKTAVLIERLMRLLSDTHNRLPADRMVVVTFTKDAAAQMKQRLADRIAERLAALSDGGDPETYDWLLTQRSALGSAHISTIHSFCFDLIREHADLLGISPQFAIGEPSQESVYRQRAMQTVLDRWGREHREDMEMLASCFCIRSDQEIESIVSRLAAFTGSLDFPQLWYRRAGELLADDGALPARMRDSFLAQVQQLVQFAQEAKPYAQAAVPDPAANPFLALLQEDTASMLAVCEKLSGVSEQEVPSCLAYARIAFSPFPRIRKNVDADNKAAFKQFRDYYKDWYNALVRDCLEPLVYAQEDLLVQRRTIPLLLSLTQQYLEELFAEKCRQNVLCFSDAEELTLELLCEIDEDGHLRRTPLARTLSEHYRLVMVDEYQDTNNKQDTIFKLLSCNGTIRDNVPLYGTNAFLVGDVKQSIYSFRQANPENFRKAAAASTPLQECRGEEMACIYLNQNFRSANGVIRFVNALFRLVMTPACGEVVYNESEELHFGALAYRNTPLIPTKLLLSGEDDDSGEDLQAECAAEQIARMLQEGAPVYLSDGTTRPCVPSDFCILMRSVKKHGKAFAGQLHLRRIPVSCERPDKLLSQPEIHLLWNLLRITDNPLTDTAMAAVLVSPVCGFTAEELAGLRLAARDRRLYLQMRRLLKKECPSQEMQQLYQKCGDFMALLTRMRELSETLPLEECIREICDLTDLFSLQSLFEDATQRREHLEMFLQQAAAYRSHADLTASGCLSGWLRYLERLRESGSDPEISGAGGDPPGCVVIKTIHKSKGLEYPFVFLVHPESGLHPDKSTRPVFPDPSGLIGLHTLDRKQYQSARDTAYTYVAAKSMAHQSSEEMRLLYVALTRARQQLFLVLDCRKMSADKLYKRSLFFEHEPAMAGILAARAGSMQDWIVDFLLAADKEHFLHALETGESCSSGLCSYETWKPAAVGEQETEDAFDLTASPDAQANAIMRRQLAYRYSSTQSQLVSKYSVTALSHPDSGQDLRMQRPAFLQEDSHGQEKKLTGAQRGTAIHKLMQYMDPAAARRNTDAELDRLLTQGFLTSQEISALPSEQLEGFLASTLCSRILASPEVRRESQIFVRIADLALPEDSDIGRSYADTDGILIGTMDLLFREEDHWVLVDYKSDYVRTAQTLLDRYALQLGLYKKAAERIFEAPVTQGYIYSFVLGEAIPVDFDSIRYMYEHDQLTEDE